MFPPHPSGTARIAAIALLVLLAGLACQKLGETEIPGTNPNPPEGPLPSPPPLGTVVIGVPNASPTATPAPSSSPVPSPAPTQTPAGGSCSLAPMPDGSPCQPETPSFLDQVQAAQAELLRNRPDLFDGPRVRSEDAYVQEVARILRTRGLCAAQGGPADEVAVKTTNDWNDQYDIVLQNGQPWTSYQVTCRPARF